MIVIRRRRFVRRHRLLVLRQRLPEVRHVHDTRDAAARQQAILHHRAHHRIEVEGVDRVGEAALEQHRGEPADRVLVAEPPLHVWLGGAGVERWLQGLHVRPQNIEARRGLARLRAFVSIRLDDVARALNPGALLLLGDAFLHLPIGKPRGIAAAEIVERFDAVA